MHTCSSHSASMDLRVFLFVCVYYSTKVFGCGALRKVAEFITDFLLTFVNSHTSNLVQSDA